MLFNSYTFLIFLVIVLIIHYLPLSWTFKKSVLLIESYIFYGAWNPPFVILLWISTIIDWIASKGIHKSKQKSKRKMYLMICLLGNLGLLFFFKYANFVLDNFVNVMHVCGINYHPAALNIILPVGISFYTFQTMSYTLDVYLHNKKPEYSFLDYALYVTFFPQLVAGPIVRAFDFLPQFAKQNRPDVRTFSWGLCLLLLGLFEKIVISDGICAPIVETVFGKVTQPDTAAAWIGTLAFANQIFCDFAGYSSCAIGAGLTLGLYLPENFKYPYAAVGFSDFWRRWHISLSSWLRDYLYIPLGGNRKGSLRTYINLFATMLLGGLWHGASWTFVVWGGLHGLYLAVERLLKKHIPDNEKWNKFLPPYLLVLITFFCVNIAWVFFRSSTFKQAFIIIKSMFGINETEPIKLLENWQLVMIAILTIIILAVHWLLRDKSIEEIAARMPWWLRSLIIAVMLISIVTLSGEDRAFIYFQF